MILADPALPPSQTARPENRPAAPGIPHVALSRLPELNGEAGQDLHLLQFLARAPHACLVLLTAGAAVWLWGRLSPSGVSLESEFFWVLSVLTSVAAITGLHIAGYARSGAPIPLDKEAAKLRWLLFYTGMAWGAGAFLMFPGVAVVGLAAIPCLGLLLGDQKGATAFNAPVTLATASACLQTSPYGLWLASATLAAGLASFCLPMLQREIRSRHDLLPVSSAR
jgi:hypothetical protein